MIIGSSNASANGLSYQDNDNLSWSEANVLIDDKKFVAKVSRWFKDIADSAQEVTSTDINKARKQWKNRRRTNMVSGKDLLTAARSNPEQFKDHRIFVCVTTGEMSDAAEESLNEARPVDYDEDGDVSCYENWPKMPKNAILIDFSVQQKPKGGAAHVTYEEIWKTPEEIISLPIKGTEKAIQLCFRRDKVLGLGVGDRNKWCEAAKKATESGSFDWDEGCAIRLDKFARKYLQDG